jgi:two-component system LytT family response regulator
MPEATDGHHPLRVVVVDDEPLARDAVRLALEAEPGCTVVAECPDGPTAVAAIRSHGPDIVFLDVQMPGMDGFAVIAAVGAAAMPPVVFVTAYDAHAVRAFGVHALDYLVKPFDDQRFRQAVAHARTQVALRHNGDLARRLTALLDVDRREPPRYATRFQVEHDERIRFVPVTDVLVFEADGNYVRLDTAGGSHRVRSTLAGVEAVLDPARFVRIHRSAIVNLDAVREVQPFFGGDYVAILTGGRRLRVSRGYRDRLLRPTL